MTKTILFGASEGLQLYMDFYFNKNKEQIVAVLDNNKQAWGKWNDIEVKPPVECLTIEFDRIIIVNRYFTSIFNQLRVIGVDEKKISVSELYLTMSGAFLSYF